MRKLKLVSTVAFLVAGLTLSTSATIPQKQESKPKVKEKASAEESSARTVAYLVNKVRKELVTLPWFGVFDWLEGEVKPDGTVYLRGQVIRPITSKDAETRVKEIEGVTQVVNEIETLPLSNADDDIRRAVYWTLFNFNSPLYRYARGVNPSIHIIVKNGRVTLKGIVATEGDSNLANIRANGVSGVFEVKNELQVERRK